jgi:hypothetical protein
LLDTEHGVAIARAILAHESEVRTLIGANKRVAAHWRHVSDPQLVEGFVAALFEPSLRVVSVPPCDARRALSGFADVLKRYGSIRLREDLAHLRDLLLAMVDLTYREIIGVLGKRTEPQSEDYELALAERTWRSATAAMDAIQTLINARSPLREK